MWTSDSRLDMGDSAGDTGSTGTMNITADVEGKWHTIWLVCNREAGVKSVEQSRRVYIVGSCVLYANGRCDAEDRRAASRV